MTIRISEPPEVDLAQDVLVNTPDGEVVPFYMRDDLLEITIRGGKGSGHHGHKGRPGKVGGSLPSGERERLESRPAATGECFKSCARWVMDEGEKITEDVRLVHGTVAGMGALEGIRFVHAWAEFGEFVWDADKQVLMHKDRYYEIGDVKDTVEYTPTETRINLLKHEHWGPWDERFEGGPWIERGGPGSGHFGHEGRPGKVGGSLPDGVIDGSPDYGVDDGAGQTVQAVKPSKVRIRYNPNLSGEAQSISTKEGVDVELGKKFWKLTSREQKALVLAHEIGHEIVDRYLFDNDVDFWEIEEIMRAPAKEQWEGRELPVYVFGQTQVDEAISQSYAEYIFEGSKPFKDRGGKYLEALKIVESAIAASPEFNFKKEHYMEMANALPPDDPDISGISTLQERGGPGSGHHGHRGRPGEIGGSLPSGAVAAEPVETARRPKDFHDVIEMYDLMPREGEEQREYFVRVLRNAGRAAMAEIQAMTDDEIINLSSSEFTKYNWPDEAKDMDKDDPAFDHLTEDQKKWLSDTYIFVIYPEYDNVLNWARKRLIASGTVDIEDFRTKWRSDIIRPQGKDWEPLPETLYHVTTAADAVKADKLKSRLELGVVSTAGLGGGEEDSVSFTSNFETAKAIDLALHEARAAARGEFTFDDMVRWAAEGRGADKPYLGLLYRLGRTHPVDEKKAEEIDRRVSVDPTDIHEDVQKWIGHMHDKIKEQGEAEIAWDVYNYRFARARQHSGGPTYPLFWGTKKEDIADSDPTQFVILELSPKPGALGYQMSGLGEWRTVGGDVVEIVGEHETLTAEEEEEYFGQ
ncbi:MAG: hypothetical protein GTN64_08665 [Candidatus Latescibacteria bacterium]|nr:hypothetical protein [Candidatus Latescibacterota bacterium]NIO78671.1 hypothetical protein [Candidatus Latescibacterota bacterium]